jgi:hypothetical protein
MKAKDLIMAGGDPQRLVEDPGDFEGSAPGQGGPPQRPMRQPGMGNAPRRPRPGTEDGAEGPVGGPPGMFTPKERAALKDLIILDMLHALGNDGFWGGIANIALTGADPTPEQMTHFLDEAGKYQKSFKPGMNELMEKIAKLRYA